MPRAKMLDGLVDQPELPLLGNLDANLGCRDEIWHVREELPHCLSRIGENAQQPRRAVERVVVAVKALAEEHVSRHLASDGRVRLFHLVLDERVTRLPHDRFAAGTLDGIRERLRALHVEDDWLAGAGAREDVARVKNENSITPHDLTLVIDDSDPIRVAIERDAELGAIFLHGGDEVLEILRHRRIGMMVRERAVAFAKNP